MFAVLTEGGGRRVGGGEGGIDSNSENDVGLLNRCVLFKQIVHTRVHIRVCRYTRD
jgi:hypothetical protein